MPNLAHPTIPTIQPIRSPFVAMAVAVTTIALSISLFHICPSIAQDASSTAIASSAARNVSLDLASQAIPHSALYGRAEFQSTVLRTTNRYRSQYSAGSVTWNSSLAQFALLHAQQCLWQHSVSAPSLVSFKRGEDPRAHSWET